MPFKNRIRLPFYLSKPQFPVDRNVFRNAVGATTLLTAVVRNTYEGKTDHLPEYWHRKLIIALVHKEVTIEDNRLLTDIVIDGEYGIDWSDFLNYPVAQGTFTIQVTPFNASSNNCQSCSEITQLNLVDDYTDTIFEEGTTNEYPDIITANDEICCYPYTIEIITFNTSYFDSVTVSSDGVLTVVVKDPVPPLSNIFIATYRVTCENGSYDEANVYGNINGSAEVCPPPTNLQVSVDPDTNDMHVTWDHSVPPPANDYSWSLYETSDLIHALTSGSTANNFVDIAGTFISAGGTYIFTINSDCGGFLLSIPATVTFNTGRITPQQCGKFLMYYVPDQSTPPQSVSFIKCNGEVDTYTFAYSHSVEQCLLVNPADLEQAIYIAASTSEISITYIEPC